MTSGGGVISIGRQAFLVWLLCDLSDINQVDGVNYHVLRTGAFPFIKYHISRRPCEDLQMEDIFYRVLKVLNFGFPTLMYGLAGLIMTKHTEVVMVKGKTVTIYFWYKENRGSPN